MSPVRNPLALAMGRFKKRHSFLLLEILIGFSLVALFFFFYLKHNVGAVQSSLQHSLDLEKQRIADLSFLSFYTKLLNGELSWQELDDYSEEEQAILSVPHMKKRTLPLMLSTSSAEKEGKKTHYKKVIVKISFEDETAFRYLLIAKQA